MEYYAGISSEKTEFFSEKLTQLFSKKQVNSVINANKYTGEKTSKPGNKCSSALKELLSSKFALRLSYFQVKELSREMIREHEIKYDIMKKLVCTEVDLQNKLFSERIFIKKTKSVKRSNRKKTSMVQSDFRRSIDIIATFSENTNLNKNNFCKIIDEVFKRIFLRFYIKLYDNSIEFTKNILNEIYYEKVKNFLLYEEDIKHVHILKSSQGGGKIT